MPEQPIITERMQNQVRRWEVVADARATFLSCYSLMTRNTLVAIEAGEFRDAKWVNTLLHRFADYYFDALEVYDRESSAAPAVWQRAHNATQKPGTMVLQDLLLGVNAHINYDLVLTLVDMLEPEWAEMSEDRRQGRYNDHCHVNRVIGRTIDTVQDDVIERQAPAMDLVDKLLGPLDEWAISRFISHWRDEVWEQALRLLSAPAPEERERLRREIEAVTLRRADVILFEEGAAGLRRLL